MRRIVWVLVLAVGCGKGHDHSTPHEGGEPEEESVTATAWGDRFEVFIEHHPLVAGIPAVDHRAWKRSLALVKMLPEFRSRLRSLEERLASLESKAKGEA